MPKVGRRAFIQSIGLAAPVALNTPALGGSAPSQTAAPAADKPTYLFFNAEEAAFIEAACERLIPADDVGPGAMETSVPNYLDKQLGGGWGSGERLYRSGPWEKGTPMQGYQLPYTPAELFRSAIRAINLELRKNPFPKMSVEEQDAFLKGLESGRRELDGVPADLFFDMLLKMTIEGYFADPVYGGNRNMAAWKMIGFPGAYANYYEAVDRHNVRFEHEPVSLASDGKGHVHINPNIPATG